MDERIISAGSATYHVLDESDLYTIREMYEMNVYRLEDSEMSPGKNILDIGANIGVFSIWAALNGANVTAYEPDPRTIPVLYENIGRNGVGHLVEIKPEGVSYKYGTMPFFSTVGTAHSTLKSEMAEQKPEQRPTKTSVTVIPMDRAIGDKVWDVVKIDAEGAEYDMIESCTKLEQIKHLCLEWHTWPGSEVLFERMCDKLRNYFDVMYDPKWNIMSLKSLRNAATDGGQPSC